MSTVLLQHLSDIVTDEVDIWLVSVANYVKRQSSRPSRSADVAGGVSRAREGVQDVEGHGAESGEEAGGSLEAGAGGSQAGQDTRHQPGNHTGAYYSNIRFRPN